MKSCAILSFGRLAVAASTTLLLSDVTLAQSSSETSGERLDEIVVTATCCEKPLIKIAASVTVQSVADLMGRGSIYGTDEFLAVIEDISFVGPDEEGQHCYVLQQHSVGGRSIWNARLARECRPLSCLYVVYNRNESDEPPGLRSPGEQVMARFTYLFEV